jgi:hypothetical protein
MFIELNRRGRLRQRPDALLVINDAAIIDERAQIATLALHHRIPGFSSIPEMTDAGGLVGYGPPARALSTLGQLREEDPGRGEAG